MRKSQTSVCKICISQTCNRGVPVKLIYLLLCLELCSSLCRPGLNNFLHDDSTKKLDRLTCEIHFFLSLSGLAFLIKSVHRHCCYEVCAAEDDRISRIRWNDNGCGNGRGNTTGRCGSLQNDFKENN